MKIKQLEWKEDREGDFTARSIGFVYDVFQLRPGKWELFFNNSLVPINERFFPEAEPAKACAQEHFETRIRSVLTAA
jgi:hypothetical protein